LIYKIEKIDNNYFNNIKSDFNEEINKILILPDGQKDKLRDELVANIKKRNEPYIDHVDNHNRLIFGNIVVINLIGRYLLIIMSIVALNMIVWSIAKYQA
jgi:hypothetical protein